MPNATNKTSKALREHPLAPHQLKIRHILVPVDFSGFARQALMCAVPLARNYHAKISLVHVAPVPIPMYSSPDGGGLMPAKMGNPTLNDIKKTAGERLSDWAIKLLPDEVRGRTVVRQGNAAYEVVAAAQSLKADVIVLSNTGRSGLRHVLLGGTAEKIVRHAHGPVLTVRRKGNAALVPLLAHDRPPYPEALPWRRILVPLDFSLTSLRALHVAVPLAKQSGARLLLLHVVEPNAYPAGIGGMVLAAQDSKLAQYANEHLSQIKRRLVPKFMDATSLVARGRAADVIVETAEKKGIDLIVLSTHGHTGLERLLIGSVAEQVVRQAKCPVFVVRKPRD